jgi:DNA-directed RNA polymerase II subunit RPB1
VKNCYLTGLTP